MLPMELKKLSISNLLLIILDKKTNSDIKQYAVIELRKRNRNFDVEIKDLLKMDSKKIEKRGYDVNNYLFGPNPSMQQLMELYLLYLYCPEQNEDYLLFSETHLCNNMNFCSKFFDKICKQEIENLSRRINKSNSKQEIETLKLVKQILNERNQKIEDERKTKYRGINLLQFNKALELLDGCLEFGWNISKEEEYKRKSSVVLILRDAILEALNDSILDYDLPQDLYAMKKIIIDSSKLNTQKRILLNQAKNGYEVNYLSEPAQKALSRVYKK